MISVQAPNIVKPLPWFPGRNPAAWNLWLGCKIVMPLWRGAMISIRHSNPPITPTLVNIDNTNEVTGYRGSCVTMNGSDEYIGVTGCEAGPSGALTMMVCLSRTGTATGWAWTEGRSDLETPLCGINSSGASMRFTIRNEANATVYVAEGVASNDGFPHTFVGTWNGATINLYKDGAFQATAACTGVISMNTSALGALVRGAVSNWFVGSFYVAAKWNRCLDHSLALALSADPFLMIRPPGFRRTFFEGPHEEAAGGSLLMLQANKYANKGYRKLAGKEA